MCTTNVFLKPKSAQIQYTGVVNKMIAFRFVKYKIIAKIMNIFLVTGGAGLVINGSALIILSFVVGLVAASIYSIYNFVILGLNGVLGSAREAVIATLGRSFHSNKQTFLNQFNNFESMYLYLAFYLASVSIIAFRPFVMLYTKHMDADYVINYLPIMFVSLFLLIALRIPVIVAINIAGHFRQVKKYALVEAILNVTLSIVLAYLLGLKGVLIGALLAASYRTPVLIKYSYSNILKISVFNCIKKIVPLIFIFVICFTISLNSFISPNNILEWMYSTILFAILIAIVYIVYIKFMDNHTFGFILKTLRSN